MQVRYNYSFQLTIMFVIDYYCFSFIDFIIKLIMFFVLKNNQNNELIIK